MPQWWFENPAEVDLKSLDNTDSTEQGLEHGILDRHKNVQYWEQNLISDMMHYHCANAILSFPLSQSQEEQTAFMRQMPHAILHLSLALSVLSIWWWRVRHKRSHKLYQQGKKFGGKTHVSNVGRPPWLWRFKIFPDWDPDKWQHNSCTMQKINIACWQSACILLQAYRKHARTYW